MPPRFNFPALCHLQLEDSLTAYCQEIGPESLVGGEQWVRRQKRRSLLTLRQQLVICENLLAVRYDSVLGLRIALLVPGLRGNRICKAVDNGGDLAGGVFKYQHEKLEY